MKEIRDKELGLDEANKQLGRELPIGLWLFLVRRLKYSEIRVDPDRGVVIYPEFIPFVDLFRETMKEVECGSLDPRPCRGCGEYFDVNEEEGIFASPDELEGFICEGCAQKMSAWDYFHHHLTKSE